MGKRRSGTERGIILPDCHVPYHDKKAYKLALSIIKATKPDYVIVIGDFADYYSVSSFNKNPSRKANLKWEIDEVNLALDQLDKVAGKAKKIFCEGNHEARLEKYLMQKAPEIFDLYKSEELFRMKERGWTWVPYQKEYKIGKLYVTHDFGRCGKACAQQTLDDFQGNIAFGHSHRASIYYSGNLRGERHVSASLGWLGDPKKVDYMHQKKLKDWTQGVGHFWIEKNGSVHLQFLPFIKGHCLVPNTHLELSV